MAEELLIKAFVNSNPSNERILALAQKMRDASLKPLVTDSDLFRAAKTGDFDRVMELLDGGVDINSRDSYGEHVIHYAAERGNEEAVRQLLDRGVDVNCKNKNNVLHCYWL